jgi:hypothetical protein
MAKKQWKPKVKQGVKVSPHYDHNKGLTPNLDFFKEGPNPYVAVPDKPTRDSKKKEEDI